MMGASDADKAKIFCRIEFGHTYHCACRQVCGDGVCDCELRHPPERLLLRAVILAVHAADKLRDEDLLTTDASTINALASALAHKAGTVERWRRSAPGDPPAED